MFICGNGQDSRGHFGPRRRQGGEAVTKEEPVKFSSDCLDFLRKTKCKVHKLTVRVNDEVLAA